MIQKLPSLLTTGLILMLFATSLMLGACGSQSIPVHPEKYQAVLLNNGQTYYGKLRSTSGTFFSLEDVYYILRDSKNNQNPNAQAASQLRLIKMGNEIYGPEDSILLNRENIIFITDLRPDSKVVKKISEAKELQKKQAQDQAKGKPAPTRGAYPSPPTKQANPSGVSPQELEQFRKFQAYQQLQQQQTNKNQPVAPKPAQKN